MGVQLSHGLVVQLSLFLHPMFAQERLGSHQGLTGARVSSVCAQSLLPLGTGFRTTHRQSACGHLCYVCIHVHRYRDVYIHSCVVPAELAVQGNAISLDEKLSSAAQSQVWGEGWNSVGTVEMQRWMVSTGKCSARAVQASGDLC